jgi:hypothetical protein
MDPVRGRRADVLIVDDPAPPGRVFVGVDPAADDEASAVVLVLSQDGTIRVVGWQRISDDWREACERLAVVFDDARIAIGHLVAHGRPDHHDVVRLDSDLLGEAGAAA